MTADLRPTARFTGWTAPFTSACDGGREAWSNRHVQSNRAVCEEFAATIVPAQMLPFTWPEPSKSYSTPGSISSFSGCVVKPGMMVCESRSTMSILSFSRADTWSSLVGYSSSV